MLLLTTTSKSRPCIGVLLLICSSRVRDHAGPAGDRNKEKIARAASPHRLTITPLLQIVRECQLSGADPGSAAAGPCCCRQSCGILEDALRMRIRRLEDTDRNFCPDRQGHRDMADALSTAGVSELIGSIYDCALDPEKWRQTLLDLRGAFGTQVAMLTLVDRRYGRVLIERSVGVDQRWRAELQRHVPEINQILEVFYSHLPPDEPRIVSRHVPLAYCQTSPYIQEFLEPQGIVDSMLYYLIDTTSRYSAVAIGKNERVFTDREVELGALLLPHIRRAVTISNVLDARTIERSRMAEALDGLRCAVILCDERGSVLHANRAAEEMLQAGSLITTKGTALQASSPSAATELRTAIAQAARNEADIGKTGLATRLDRPGRSTHLCPCAADDGQRAAHAPAAHRGRCDLHRRAARRGRCRRPHDRRLRAHSGGEARPGGPARGPHACRDCDCPRGRADDRQVPTGEDLLQDGVSRQADLIRLASRMTPPTG